VSALPLAGKTALVTGGGSGIGLGCARVLVRDGCHVTIMGRTEARLSEAAAGLRASAPAGVTIAVAAGDVSDEAAVIAAVERAAAPTGKLDVAVANAGAGAGGPIFSTTVEMWRYTMDVNLTGTFLTFKHAGQRQTRLVEIGPELKRTLELLDRLARLLARGEHDGISAMGIGI